MKTAAAQAGLATAAVAYGYAMTGTSTTTCASTTVQSALITTAGVFSGAKYQHINAFISASGEGAAVTIATKLGTSALTTSGSTALYTAADITVLTYILANTIAGLITKSAQNAYWDFMQTEVIMANTAYGRGGGTGPCGWWVAYFFENSQWGNTGATATSVTSWNIEYGTGGATINMWTDNSMIQTLSGFALALFATLAY